MAGLQTSSPVNRAADWPRASSPLQGAFCLRVDPPFMAGCPARLQNALSLRSLAPAGRQGKIPGQERETWAGANRIENAIGLNVILPEVRPLFLRDGLQRLAQQAQRL